MYRQGEKAIQSQDARNSGVLRSWYNRWVWASYANFDQIEKEMVRNKAGIKRKGIFDQKVTEINCSSLSKEAQFKAIEDAQMEWFSDYSLVKHSNKHAGKPAIIVGSGMSLEKLIPLLKDWKGVIFAPESMVSTLKYYGHKPEYICLFDAGITAWDMWFKGQNYKGSTLITHPSVDPKVIEYWEGDKIYYLMRHISALTGKIKQTGKSMQEIDREVKYQLLGFDFFDNILPTVYGFIGAAILNAGCVVNNAVEVANFMGFGPLFLCGVDFGFKDWVNRFPMVKKIKGRWVKDKIGYIEHEENGEKIGDAPAGREIIISDNGIPTTDEQAEYKLALMCVYKLDKPQLIDCSDGIITELPKADIKEVVEKNGKGFESKYRTGEEIVRCADAYLNRR